jgi:hypothetical protein
MVYDLELYQTTLSGTVTKTREHRGYLDVWLDRDTVAYLMSFYARKDRGYAQLAYYLIGRGDSIIKAKNSDSIFLVHKGHRIGYRLLFPGSVQSQIEQLQDHNRNGLN